MKIKGLLVFFVCALSCSLAFARGNVRQYKISEDLTPSGMSFSQELSRDAKLHSVILHGDTALSETITISVNSAFGADYDAILKQDTLSSESNYVWYPDGEITLKNGDSIEITSTYNDTDATVYGTLTMEDWA